MYVCGNGGVSSERLREIYFDTRFIIWNFVIFPLKHHLGHFSLPSSTHCLSTTLPVLPQPLPSSTSQPTTHNLNSNISPPVEQVIVTSYLFPEGRFSQPRLDEVLASLGGDKSKLVIDLSCRRAQGEQAKWFVAMDKWQRITDMEVCEGMSDIFDLHVFVCLACGRSMLGTITTQASLPWLLRVSCFCAFSLVDSISLT